MADGLSPQPLANQPFVERWRIAGDGELAETEGFEPSVPVNPVRRFSKPLVSATHPRLRRFVAIAAARRAINRAGGVPPGA